MERISWTDHVRNEEILLWVKEQWNILHEIRKRKANWIGHILCRNCFLKQVIERKTKGEMEVTRRRGRRRKKLLDDLKDRRGYSHLKEEALDRTMWRNRFGGGFGPVVRQNNEWIYKYMYIYIYIPFLFSCAEFRILQWSTLFNCIGMYLYLDVSGIQPPQVHLMFWLNFIGIFRSVSRKFPAYVLANSLQILSHLKSILLLCANYNLT